MSSISTSRFQAFPLRRLESNENAEDLGQAREELADEGLLVSVQAGDCEALARLFQRHARVVRGIGQRILRDRSEADDLVQEVFLYIHRKSSSFDRSKGSARSWIVQVAYTQALLRRRDLKSHGLYASAIADKSQESEFCSNSETEYDLSVEGLFGRRAWRKVLDDLTPDQRETLRLHFFEGYTFSEISEKLSQSYASVRHHHYRALEKLRKHLAAGELSRR